MNTVLLCRSAALPVFEPIVDLLVKEGYKAALRIIIGNPVQLLAAEIEYEPHRMPIIVRVGPDFAEDSNASDFEFWQLVADHRKNKPKPSSDQEGMPLFGGKKMVVYFRELLLSELAPENRITQNVRRFVSIRAMDNADSLAMQMVVDMLREQCDAL